MNRAGEVADDRVFPEAALGLRSIRLMKNQRSFYSSVAARSARYVTRSPKLAKRGSLV